MQTANRASPHVMLGALTLLSLGAIVLSLDTAPPNAQSQLRTAAGNTAGATSFVLTDTVTTGPPTAAASSTTTRQQAVFAYQSPDRVEESVHAGNQVGTVLWVGTHAYERIGTGKWFPISGVSTSTSTTGQLAASQLLLPIQAVAQASGVAQHGSIYAFTPGDERLLLARLFGSELVSGTTSYEATVAGEFLSVAQITVENATQRRTVNLALSNVDHGPALQLPPPSDITTSPLGSG